MKRRADAMGWLMLAGMIGSLGTLPACGGGGGGGGAKGTISVTGGSDGG